MKDVRTYLVRYYTDDGREIFREWAAAGHESTEDTVRDIARSLLRSKGIRHRLEIREVEHLDERWTRYNFRELPVIEIELEALHG
jgi:plasmid stability protein